MHWIWGYFRYKNITKYLLPPKGGTWPDLTEMKNNQRQFLCQNNVNYRKKKSVVFNSTWLVNGITPCPSILAGPPQTWSLDRGVSDISGPWFWEHQVAITPNFHLVISSAHCLFISSVTDLCSDCCVWQQLPQVTMPRAPPRTRGAEHLAISQNIGEPSCTPHQVGRVRMLHSLSNKMHTLAALNQWRALHGNLHQKLKKCMLMSFCKLESCRCQERTTWIEQRSVISAGGV